MPAIKKPSEHFDATLWTGTGVARNVTNSGSMQPDFVWIKNRGAVGQHVLTNSVAGGNKQLFSSNTDAEQTNANITNGFTSNGFTVGDNSDGTGSTNQNTNTYVGWQWKAGGTAVTNTSGTISSQVSANPTAGFSVVTWVHSSTTSTIGHGLGVAPQFLIVKSRTTGYNWDVGCNSIGWANRLNLNTTDAAYSPAFWNSTAPTSTVFTYAGSGASNGDNMVAYCFTPIAGYSAFGSYTGNGSADGTFVYLGFRPKFIVIKSTGVEDWRMFDTSRSTYNIQGATLYPNASSAENAAQLIDINSNGFKCRTTDGAVNGSGTSYIYMAFAESPFKFSNAR